MDKLITFTPTTCSVNMSPPLKNYLNIYSKIIQYPLNFFDKIQRKNNFLHEKVIGAI